MYSCVLLEKSLNLTPKNDKTNIKLPFEICEDFSEIYIDTCYHPKFFYDIDRSTQMIDQCIDQYQLDPETDLYEGYEAILPLCNFVNFSVDMNGAYLGSALRHCNAQHVLLKPNGSTPGFSVPKIERGHWDFVINVFALITETCDYRVRITGIRR